MPDNRRKNPRAACSFEGKVLGPRGSVRGMVKNISVGGFYLAGKDLLPVGTNAEAELALGGQKMKVVAEVRHHQRIDDLPGMGLKFVRLDAAVLAAIEKIVDASQAAQPQV